MPLFPKIKVCSGNEKKVLLRRWKEQHNILFIVVSPDFSHTILSLTFLQNMSNSQHFPEPQIFNLMETENF